MAITVTVQQLINAKTALQVMGNLKLKGRAGYWAGRLDSKLNGDWKENDAKRIELVKKHGEQDAKGNWKVPQANSDAFEKEWKPIADEKIEIQCESVNLSIFANEDIPAGCMMALEPFIKDDEAPNPNG